MKANRKHSTWALMSYFFTHYPLRTAFMIISLLFAGMAEGIGIVTLLPLFELATAEGGQSVSRISQFIQFGLSQIGLTPTLTTLLLVIVSGVALKAVFLMTAMVQVGYAVANIMTDMRLLILRSLLNAKWSHFVSRKTGFFVNAVTYESSVAASTYNSICQLLAAAIQAMVYIVLVIVISVEIALMAVVAAVVLVFLMNWLVELSRKAGIRQTELMKSLNARLTDVIHGIKPIKAMSLESRVSPLLESETEGLNMAHRRQVAASEALKIIHEPIVAVILGLGIYMAVTLAGIEISALIVTAFMFHRLMTRIHATQQYYQSIANGEAAFWSLQKNIAEAINAMEKISTGESKEITFNRSINFDSVCFSYDANKQVLKGTNIDIPVGSFVAVIGPSGAGKTTIADLVLGLYEPDSGAINIDDVNLKDINLAQWRQMTGYVPQEMTLFHDSVRNNLTLGDENISDEMINKALQDAGALEFVLALPEDLDTVVGERGSKLSGGQRQRLSIARALLRQPKLLILDEVTTALDPKTEQALCDTLKGLSGKVTILAISHQQAITSIADKVYRIEDGQLTEMPRTDSDGNKKYNIQG